MGGQESKSAPKDDTTASRRRRIDLYRESASFDASTYARSSGYSPRSSLSSTPTPVPSSPPPVPSSSSAHSPPSVHLADNVRKDPPTKDNCSSLGGSTALGSGTHMDTQHTVTDHPDHMILFRKYVSRKAAGKGRAVLEGVGLDSETIDACFNGSNEEEAVQAGLIKWCGGRGYKLATWGVLFAAMEYAQLAQQHVHDLKKESGLFDFRKVLDFRDVLKKALTKGYVQVEIIKCVTFGPPEAGKTQLKSGLMGRFDDSNESTDVSTAAEIVMQRYVCGKTSWEPLIREQLLKSLHTTVATEDFEAKDQCINASATAKIDAVTSSVKVEEPEHQQTVNSTIHHEVDRNDALLRQFSILKESVERELKDCDSTEVSCLRKLRMIHFIDSGGQPAFLDVHPVITSSRAIYLLLYNMEEGLEAKPKFTYRKSSFSTKEVPNEKKSNMDMISESLLVLHHCQQKFAKMDKKLHKWFGKSIVQSENVPVLVVGTRRDDQKMLSESEKLSAGCSHLPTWSEVLDCTDSGTKLFAVESKSKRCKGLQSVLDVINETECSYHLPLPISWVFCQLIFWSTDQEQFHVLNYADLRYICIKKQVVATNKEFLAMIRVFHYLGIFCFPYFDQEETLGDSWKPDTHPVFTNPDVLYRHVTRILEVVFINLVKTKMIPEAKKRLRKLQNDGRLRIGTLCHLNIPDQLGSFSGFQSYLLELFVQWGLAAKLDSMDSAANADTDTDFEYFIPSVLPASGPEYGLNATGISFDLAFTFERSQQNMTFYYIPRGIFPHVVANILTAHKHYYLNPGNECLYRDMAIFVIRPSPCNTMNYSYNVLLTDKMDHISIRIQPSHAAMKWTAPDCHQIKRDFKLAIEDVHRRIYLMDHSVTLACQCPCRRFPKDHLAAILTRTNQCYLQCLSLYGLYHEEDCPEDITTIVNQGSGQAPAPANVGGAKKQDKVAATGSISQFLKGYEKEFMDVVDAKQSLRRLTHEGVISPDIERQISDANADDAKYILFEHLEKHATVDTLKAYCDVAIGANGFPKMKRLGNKLKEALPIEDVQEGPVDRPQLPLVSHSTPVQKDQATAILAPNPPPTMPQLRASDKVDTSSDTGPLEDNPPVSDAADSVNAQYIPKPQCMEVKHTTPIATEDSSMSCNSRVNTEGELQIPKMCSHKSGSVDSLSNTLSAYHDNLKMQSSQFDPCSSSPTQHCSSHPGHTGLSSSGPQLNVPDVKERLSGSDSATDATGGAHDSSCVVDHSSASTFPLKLSKQSQSQKSDRLTGPEHTSKSAHSHSEAQSGAGIQSHASHHGTHTPDQSSMVSNPLWETAKLPAVHTSAEISSSMQSQHQKGSADNAAKSVCVLATGLHLHSDVVATSEPVIDVKGSFDLTSPHHSLQKPSAPAPLARSPGPVHSSVTPAHLLSQHPNSSVSLALPHSPGSANSSETLPHVSSQQTNSSLSLTLPPSPEGFSDSEPEECDSTARPLKPPATNSAQFLQMQNSSLTGFPATSDQTHPSPSIIPTKEHILLSNPASHPSQQSALNEDSLDGETSDDDDDPRDKETSDYTPSDLTYQSSTSGPTTRNPTTDDSRNSSLSQALHPPTTGTQPRASSHDAHSDLTYQSSTTSGPTRNPRTEDSRNSSFSQALHPPFLSITSAEVSSSIQSQHQKGSPDDDDDAHSDLTYQSSTTSGSNIWHLQNSSQFFSLATSDKTHPSPSTKEHSLLLNPASHPTQKSAPIEGTSEEETSNDDDDAHSDFTYQSSTTSGSTTRKPTTEDSQNSSLSQALHPPIASMQPRTSSLLTVSHPVTPALGIAGSGKMTSFADMHAPVGPHSNATGDEQSQTSGHPALLGMQPRTASLTPAVATAGCDEMTSFVDMHTAVGPHSNVTGDKQSHNSDQSAQALVNSREQQLSAHHSQKPTTHSNPSVNVPSHLEPAVVGLPPSKVPSMIDKSAETYPSAATVVEAAHEADTTGAPASSSPVEQPLAVSGKVGSSAVPSTLPDVHWQDSGYLCSHHFVSSNISHRHLGSMDPSDRIQMDTSQREQDSQESVQCVEQLIGSSKKEVEMLAYVSRQVGQKWSMLARYAGLEKDEIQRIKRSSQNRPCTIMTKIQGRLTWNELLNVVQKHMHMLNTAAKLQHFLGHPVEALPDLVHNEIDPQQYSRTLLVASQCVSEHWKELAQYLGINPHQHWDVLEESSDADEKCHGVLLLWLSGRRATLQELLEAVESTSAAAGSLQKLIEMARLDGQL